MMYATYVQNSNFKYFVLWAIQKWKKCVDVSMHSFKSLVFIRFCHFSVAHNTKNFVLHFCMLTGYNIDYVHIFFKKNYKKVLQNITKWRDQ
jgi:hypothetical protein